MRLQEGKQIVQVLCIALTQVSRNPSASSWWVWWRLIAAEDPNTLTWEADCLHLCKLYVSRQDLWNGGSNTHAVVMIIILRIYVQCWALCLTYNKFSINISCFYYSHEQLLADKKAPAKNWYVADLATFSSIYPTHIYLVALHTLLSNFNSPGTYGYSHFKDEA